MEKKTVDELFHPIAMVSASAEVYRRLKQTIVDGDLAPGTRLIERVLAENLQVSRTPVREALQRLTAEGLVTPDGSRGLIVARVSIETVKQAYLFREVVEGLAARLAAHHNRPDLLRSLAESLSVMEHEVKEPAHLDEAHSRFHHTIAEMSGNIYVIQTLKGLDQFRTRMVSLDWITSARVHASIPEHRLIFEAIEVRDGDLAEARAKAHVRTTREGLMRRLNGADKDSDHHSPSDG